MNSIQPLRFITRAVLPLVYDESLSYYEFLCRVLDKLNIVITNSNTQSEAIKALNTELKNKEDTANKTQTITDSSTEAQYPSAKAVFEYVNSLNANNTKY